MRLRKLWIKLDGTQHKFQSVDGIPRVEQSSGLEVLRISLATLRGSAANRIRTDMYMQCFDNGGRNIVLNREDVRDRL